jgi:hypothetical protein
MLCGIFRHLCLILTTDSYNAHSYIRLPAHAKPPRILFVLPIRPLKEFDNIQPRTPFAFFHHPLGIAFRLGRTRPVTSVFMFKRIVRARGRVGRTCIVRHDRKLVPPWTFNGLVPGRSIGRIESGQTARSWSFFLSPRMAWRVLDPGGRSRVDREQQRQGIQLCYGPQEHPKCRRFRSPMSRTGEEEDAHHRSTCVCQEHRLQGESD